MNKLEVKPDVWIDVYATLGYAIGICEGISTQLGELSSDDEVRIKNALDSCVARIEMTLTQMSGVGDD